MRLYDTIAVLLLAVPCCSREAVFGKQLKEVRLPTCSSQSAELRSTIRWGSIAGNGVLVGAAGGEDAKSLLRDGWLKLACSAKQELSDGSREWSKLGAPTRMRDSEARISGLAMMRMFKTGRRDAFHIAIG